MRWAVIRMRSRRVATPVGRAWHAMRRSPTRARRTALARAAAVLRVVPVSTAREACACVTRARAPGAATATLARRSRSPVAPRQGTSVMRAIRSSRTVVAAASVGAARARSARPASVASPVLASAMEPPAMGAARATCAVRARPRRHAEAVAARARRALPAAASAEDARSALRSARAAAAPDRRATRRR